MTLCIYITMSRKLLSWATSSHVSCAIIYMCLKATYVTNLSGSMVRTPTRCCCFMHCNRSSLQNSLHVPNWLHVGKEKLTTPQRSRKAYKHTPNKSSGSSMRPLPPQDVALIPTSNGSPILSIHCPHCVLFKSVLEMLDGLLLPAVVTFKLQNDASLKLYIILTECRNLHTAT